MSPDSPAPSRTRRAWRFMSALGCVLAAASILLSVILFTRINAERERNIRANCQETNARNAATVRQLDELLKRRLAETDSPAERRRIVQSRQSTVVLLDAILPVKDCDLLVRRQVASSKP